MLVDPSKVKELVTAWPFEASPSLGTAKAKGCYQLWPDTYLHCSALPLVPQFPAPHPAVQAANPHRASPNPKPHPC